MALANFIDQSSSGSAVDTELPAAAAAADNTANPTAPAVLSFGMLWDSATWDRAPGTAADGALVNLGANNDVTVTSISAGNNNIGDVDVASIAAGDNNIGNVDIVTVPAPLSTTGGGTEATALRVTVASDSTGVLSVDDNGSSLTVDNGGTFVVQENGAALTALQLIDDTVATLGTTTFTEAATKGLTMGAVRRDADTTLVDTTNEIGPLQMDANGRLKVEVFSGETLPVSGTVTANLSATDNAVLDAIAASVSELDSTNRNLGSSTYTEGNAFAVTTAVAVRRDADTTLADTTNEWAPLQVDANGRLKVEVFDGGDSHTVDNGGTFVVQENGAALTALQIMDDWDNGASDGASVSGDVAHDTADAGEPVKIGGKGVTAAPAAVTANDRVNAQFDIYGRQVGIAALREMKGAQITTITSSTSETTCVTADATYKLDVYGVLITNTSATATEVSFKDSTAGTTRFWVSVPANDMRGFVLPMDAGHNQNAANNNWTATCADSVASVIITVLFVKNL